MSWELVKELLGYVSGPVVGAIIGLITNYLAVVMLFHPYEPIKLFGVRLPFTPGIIPKRKDALAHAIGKAVGEDLFTSEDLTRMLCSEKVEGKLIEHVKGTLKKYTSSSIDEILSRLASEEAREAFRERLSVFLAERIIASAEKMDVGELVASKGKEAILEKKASLGMLGMFLTDGIIDPLLEQVKEKVSLFLTDEGVETALPVIRDEVSVIATTPINEQIDFSRLDEDKITSLVRSIYEGAVVKAISSLADGLDICSIVEQKVNEMSLKDLEALCKRIMKKELRALVILGGAIGFIIGIINIFI
ncbi:MAG: DUF445 family protein [Clostridia bacterium]|nr:DUF445 family protein [Clostridia bacterium]